MANGDPPRPNRRPDPPPEDNAEFCLDSGQDRSDGPQERARDDIFDVLKRLDRQLNAGTRETSFGPDGAQTHPNTVGPVTQLREGESSSQYLFHRDGSKRFVELALGLTAINQDGVSTIQLLNGSSVVSTAEITESGNHRSVRTDGREAQQLIDFEGERLQHYSLRTARGVLDLTDVDGHPTISLNGENIQSGDPRLPQILARVQHIVERVAGTCGWDAEFPHWFSDLAQTGVDPPVGNELSPTTSFDPDLPEGGYSFVHHRNGDEDEEEERQERPEQSPSETTNVAQLVAALENGDASAQQQLASLGSGSQRQAILESLLTRYASCSSQQGSERLRSALDSVLTAPDSGQTLVGRLAGLINEDDSLAEPAARALVAMMCRQTGDHQLVATAAAREIEQLLGLGGDNPITAAVQNQLDHEFPIATPGQIDVLSANARRSQIAELPHLQQYSLERLQAALQDNSLAELEPGGEQYGQRLPAYRQALLGLVLNGDLDHERLDTLPGQGENRQQFLTDWLAPPPGATQQQQAELAYARLFAQGGLNAVLDAGSDMPPGAYHAVLNVAAAHISRATAGGDITAEQAEIVAKMLALTEQRFGDDSALRSTLSSILSDGLRQPESRDAVIQALDRYAADPDSADSRDLAALHARTFRDGDISARFDQLLSAAQDGSLPAQRALAVLCNGRSDALARAQEDDRERADTTPGAADAQAGGAERQPLSRRAADALLALAEDNETRRRLADYLLDAYRQQSGAVQTETRDTSLILQTMARLTGELPVGQANPEALRAISTGFRDAMQHPGTLEYAHAREAMQLIAPHWDAADARLFVQNLSAATVEALRSTIARVPPAARQAIAEALNERAAGNGSDSVHARNGLEVVNAAPRFERARIRVPGDPPDMDRAPIGSWPNEAEWRALWRREFGDGWPVPLDVVAGAANFEQPRYGWHHEEFIELSRRHFRDANSTGLEQLRGLTYDFMAGRGGMQSVKDYWSNLAYIDSVRRYEAARAGNEGQIAHGALVDLISLQRSAGCTDQVREMIERYLHGERRPTEQELVRATRECQLREHEASQQVGPAFAQLLTGRNQAELHDAAIRFNTAANAAGINPEAAAWATRFSAARQLEMTAGALAQPGGANDPVRRQALATALQRVADAFAGRGDGQLQDAFGERGIAGAISDLNSPEHAARALEQARAFLQNANVRQILNDGQNLIRLPLSTNDLLRTGLLGEDGLSPELRDFAVHARIQEAVGALANPSAAGRPANLANLRAALEELATRQENNRLLTAFGGRNAVEQLVTRLNDENQRTAAIQSIQTLANSNGARAAIPRLTELAANPDTLARLSIPNDPVQATRAGQALASILPGRAGENADGPIDYAARVRTFLDSVGRGGARNADAARAWVTAYGGLQTISQAFDSLGDQTQVGRDVEAGLQMVLTGGEQAVNRDVIAAFGGRQAIQRLIDNLHSGGQNAEQALETIGTAMSSDAVHRFEADAPVLAAAIQADTPAQSAENAARILRSGALGNPDLMAALRNNYAAHALGDALRDYNANQSEDNRLALRHAIGLMQARDSNAPTGSASGGALIEALGGRAELARLRDAIVLGGREAGEITRAMLTRHGNETTQNLLTRGMRDIQNPPETPSPQSLLRPGISADEIARAIEGSRQRGNSANAAYTEAESAFLRRPTDGGTVLDAAQREQALQRLEQAGLAGFAQGGDDQRMLNTGEYRAVHQLLRLQEAHGNSTDQARELRALIDLAGSGNTHAQDLLRQLNVTQDNHSYDANSLLHMLERGNTEEQGLARSILTGHLPDGNQRLDELRVRSIVHDTLNTAEPTVQQIDAVRARLQEEADACNECAARTLGWADAQRALARLTARGGGLGTPQDRSAAIDDLFRMANEDGNLHARDALIATLNAGIGAPLELGRDGVRPFVPDLSHLGQPERHALLDRSISAIDRLIQANPSLSTQETEALAIALGRVRSTDAPLALRINSIIERAWQNPESRQAIMDGLLSASMRQPPVEGTRAIADIYLRHADHLQFAQNIRAICDRALYFNDTTAMYMIAGGLGRQESRGRVGAELSRTADALARNPELAPRFIEALRDRFHTAGDQANLLATLGSVAANPAARISAALRSEVQTELRTAIQNSFLQGSTLDAAARPTYASAVRGLTPLAEHWTDQDRAALTRRFTPEVVEALRTAGSRADSSGIAIVRTAMERISNTATSSDERVSAFQAVGALGRHVSAEQVRVLGSFAAGGGTTAEQQAASRALLQIINANGPGRDAAVTHFTESGWARGMEPALRDALIQYARGRDVTDTALLGRVSELAYDANIRPPIGHVLRTLGINDIPRERLDAAIARVGGEEPFRQLLTRIQTYDALPASLQALIRSGSTDVSQLTPADLSPAHGGARAQTNIRALIDHLQTAGLADRPPANPQANPPFAHLAGNLVNERLDNLRTSVLNQMGARAGMASDGRHSAENVDHYLRLGRISAYTGEGDRVGQRTTAPLEANRTRTLNQLCRMTQEGPGAPWWLAVLSTPTAMYRAYRVNQYENEQGQLIGNLENLGRDLERTRGETNRLSAVVQALDIAHDTQRVFEMTQAGDRRGADERLLRMASEHSLTSLQSFSPGAFTLLTGTGPAPWQQGAWGRLQRYDLTAAGEGLPTFRVGQREVVDDAIQTLTRRNLRSRPEGQLRYEGNNSNLSDYAHEVLVHEALRALDTNPSTVRATTAAAEFHQAWSELDALQRAGINGHRGEAFVRHIRGLVRSDGPPLTDEQVNQRVQQLQTQLGETTNLQARAVLETRIRDLERNRREDSGLQPAIERIQSEIPQMRRTLTQLEEARRQATDADAIRGLESRISALRGMIDTFRPGSRQMQQFTEMFRLINSGSFDESTLWRSLRDNAVPIALTIGACALIIATCGAATPLAVIGGAALMAGSGLLIREGYAELSYQANWNGQRGSMLGDSIRRWEQSVGLRDSGFLVYDQQTGRMVPGPTFGETFRQYGWDFLREFGTNLAMMGFGSLVGKALQYASAGVRDAAALQSLGRVMGESGRRATGLERLVASEPAAQSWVQRFLHECRGQIGFAIAQDATHEAIMHGFDQQNVYTELAAAMICCLGHQGLTHMHAHGLRPRWAGPGRLEVPVEREAFMREFRQRLNSGETGEHVHYENMPNGNVRVTINGRPLELSFVSPQAAAHARMQEHQRALAEGNRGNQSADATAPPPGRPHGFEGRRESAPAGRASEVDSQHHLSERAPTARTQMDQWVDHAQAGRYDLAAEHALNCAGDMHAGVSFHNVDIPIGQLQSHLPQHLGAMGGPHGNEALQPHATGTGQHVDVQLSRPRLVLADGTTTVDLTRLSTERARLSEPQRLELDAALQTPAGQAIMRRAALQYMEEVILHGNQILGGGRISYVQSQFDAAVANPAGGQRHGPALREWQNHGADAHGQAFSPVAAEQEVLAFMFERGARWEDIMAVANNPAHIRTRENMIEWLRANEAAARAGQPVVFTPPPRLPGAPDTVPDWQRSGLPRRLFEGTEVTEADRQQWRDMRDQVSREVAPPAGGGPDPLPPGVRAGLEALIPPRTSIESTNADHVHQAARDLAMVRDIMRLPPEIRAHLLDHAISNLEPITADQMATARFAHQLAQAGVPMDRLTALTPELLNQIRLSAESLPPQVRRAVLDPILSQPYERAAFNRAMRDATAIASETDPVRQMDALAQRRVSGEPATTARNNVLSEMMLSHTGEYRTALAAASADRTPAQQQMIASMERARGALRINEHVWQNVVIAHLNETGATDATIREAFTRARELSAAAQRHGITDLEAAFRLPAALRESFIDPLLRRPSLTAAEFNAEVAIARQYADRGLTPEQLTAARTMEPEARRLFLDPVVTGDSFSSAAFDQALASARTYAAAPLEQRVDSTRRIVADLETRSYDEDGLSTRETRQLEQSREVLRQRMAEVETQIRSLETRGTPLDATETARLNQLRTLSNGHRLVEQNVVDQAMLNRMTAEQVNRLAEIDPAVRRHFMANVLAGREGFEHFAQRLQEAHEFNSRPLDSQMRSLRSELNPLEGRQNSTSNPLSADERVRMNNLHELLFDRLQHSSREIRRLEGLTTRTAEQNEALEQAHRALREEIDVMERRLNIGDSNNSDSRGSNRAEVETWQLLREIVGNDPNLAVIRLRGGSTMDGVGFDFAIIDRRTGQMIAVDPKDRTPVAGRPASSEPEYRNNPLRENAVLRFEFTGPRNSLPPAQRTALAAQLRHMIAGIPNSPLNLGDIRLPFDQAHTAPTVRRLTAPEQTAIAQQVRDSQSDFQQAVERHRRNPRGREEPQAPRPITLPTGEIVEVPLTGQPQNAMRAARDMPALLAPVIRETGQLNDHLNGRPLTRAGDTPQQVVARLTESLRTAEAARPQLEQHEAMLRRYVADLQAREQALRQQGRTADADAVRDMRDHIQRGALEHAQQQIASLDAARRALEQFRAREAAGPGTTGDTAPPNTGNGSGTGGGAQGGGTPPAESTTTGQGSGTGTRPGSGESSSGPVTLREGATATRTPVSQENAVDLRRLNFTDAAINHLSNAQADVLLATLSRQGMQRVVQAIESGRMTPQQLSAAAERGADHVRLVNELLQRLPNQSGTQFTAALNNVITMSEATIEHARTLLQRTAITPEALTNALQGSPRFLEMLAGLDGATHSINRLLGGTNAITPLKLEQILNGIPAGERSTRVSYYSHPSIGGTPGAIDFLLSVPQEQRSHYERGLAMSKLTLAQAREVAALPGPARALTLNVLDHLGAREIETNRQDFRAVRDGLARAALTDAQLERLSTLMTNGNLSVPQLQSLLSLSPTVRAAILPVLSQNVTRHAITTLMSHVESYSRLLSQGVATPSDVATLLQLPQAHRDNCESVLSRQAGLAEPQRMSAESRSRLLRDADFAATESARGAPPAAAALTTPRGHFEQSAHNLSTAIDGLPASRPGQTTTRAELQESMRIVVERLQNSSATDAELQSSRETLDVVRRALADNPNTNLALAQEIIDNVSQGLRNSGAHLGLGQMLTRLISTPEGNAHYQRLETLAHNRNLVSAPTGSGTVSMQGLPGWRVEPGVQNGQLTLVHDGAMRVPAGRVQELQGQGWVETSRNPNGTVNMRLETPVRINASVDDVLLRGISTGAGGPDNCARSVAAYLRNIMATGGAEGAVRRGEIVTPQPLARRNVSTSDLLALIGQTGVQTHEMPHVNTPAELTQPGLYVCTTGYDSSGNGHTFLVRVRAGERPVVLDASLGTTRDANAYGIRRDSGRIWRITGPNGAALNLPP